MHQARSIATRLRSNHSGINLSIRPGRFSSGKSQLVPILFRNLHIKSSPHTQSSIAALGARRCCRLSCSSVFFVLNFPHKKIQIIQTEAPETQMFHQACIPTLLEHPEDPPIVPDPTGRSRMVLVQCGTQFPVCYRCKSAKCTRLFAGR